MRDRGYRRTCAVFLLAAVLLAGCRTGLPSATEVKETQAYSLPETMIVVATERNRYQEIYTDRIWGVKLDGEGTTFQSYLLNQIRIFLQEMKTMNLLAEQEGIEIDTAEKDQINKLSKEYYGKLTRADIDYMGISEENVKTMYEEYYRANKVVNELTKDVDLEISDSEAKVVTIQLIQCADEAAASEAYEKIKEKPDDFEAIAREYSQDKTIQMDLGRGEKTGNLEKVAFSLAAGGISGIFPYEDAYCIVKCVNDYNESATQERKARLYQDRKREAFNQRYSQFKAENPVTFGNDVWEKIVFSSEDKTTTTNFFELYKKYFPD